MAPRTDYSGITKARSGIAGFDEITGGGFPCGRSSLIIGSPGAGKTIFALETLVNAARDFGEAGIFIAFEENSRQIVENSATFGWDGSVIGNQPRPRACDAGRPCCFERAE